MGRNKLLTEVDGVPLLRRVAETAVASSARPVILVTGNEADDVERTVSGLPLSIVRNQDFRRGLSASLICGINAVPEDCDGVLVLLGDMPGVTCDLIDRLIAAFAPEDGRAICVANMMANAAILSSGPANSSRTFVSSRAMLAPNR